MKWVPLCKNVISSTFFITLLEISNNAVLIMWLGIPHFTYFIFVSVWIREFRIGLMFTSGTLGYVYFMSTAYYVLMSYFLVFSLVLVLQYLLIFFEFLVCSQHLLMFSSFFPYLDVKFLSFFPYRCNILAISNRLQEFPRSWLQPSV